MVFGHFLEYLQIGDGLYKIIYSFHMAAFIFISGFFTKSYGNNSIKSIWIYLIFQVIYSLFEGLVFYGRVGFKLFTPYWLLWYMLALFFYRIVIKVFLTKKLSLQIFNVVFTVVISLVASFFEFIGYFLSISRIITFLPYFLCGFYLKESKLFLTLIIEKADRQLPSLKITACTIICLLVAVVCGLQLSSKAFYGSYSYNLANYGWLDKLLIYLVGGIFCFALVIAFPKKGNKVLNRWGKNSLCIYLMHGFLVKIFCQLPIVANVGVNKMLFSIIITFYICTLFGNGWFKRIFYKLTLLDLFDKNSKNCN